MGSLVLPYPNLDFVPLDVLTAEEQNQIVANIKATADYANKVADGFEMKTSEIRVGTWINGKPIYRMVFSGTVVAQPQEAKIIELTSIRIDELLGQGGYIDIGFDGILQAMPSVGVYERSATLSYDPKKEKLRLESKTNVRRDNAPYKVWADYTKRD